MLLVIKINKCFCLIFAECRRYSQHAYVDVLTRGDLSSLTWIESPLKYFDPNVEPEVELCHVNYTSLNFRDVMLATGKLPPDAIPGDAGADDCLLGMEFSGKNSKGENIMGLVPAKVESFTQNDYVHQFYHFPKLNLKREI